MQELAGGGPSANILTGEVDEHFLRSDINGIWNFLTDALGSTAALADSNGAIQTQYTYEPFGNTSLTGVLDSNSSQYTGREDDGTGLYFYRGRYYYPALQRFASEDRIGLAGGNANLYAYVSNDPISLRDPNGNCPICVIAAIGGVVGGAVAGFDAYHAGARGWNLAAAVAGGAGAGILAGLTGTYVSTAAAPVIGEAIGLGAGALETQILAGAAGGAAGVPLIVELVEVSMEI